MTFNLWWSVTLLGQSHWNKGHYLPGPDINIQMEFQIWFLVGRAKKILNNLIYSILPPSHSFESQQRLISNIWCKSFPKSIYSMKIIHFHMRKRCHCHTLLLNTSQFYLNRNKKIFRDVSNKILMKFKLSRSAVTKPHTPCWDITEEEFSTGKRVGILWIWFSSPFLLSLGSTSYSLIVKACTQQKTERWKKLRKKRKSQTQIEKELRSGRQPLFCCFITIFISVCRLVLLPHLLHNLMAKSIIHLNRAFG